VRRAEAVKLTDMETKSEVHLLFPTVIQVTDVEDSEAFNEHLLKELDKIRKTTENSLPPSWSCTLYTTIASGFSLLEREEFAGLGNIIIEEATKFANTLRLDLEHHALKLNECWVNIYGLNDSQESHIHQNSVISGIYYVKAPKGCAEVLFHSPMADSMLEPPTSEVVSHNTSIVAFTPQPGRIILFRSSLRHSVRANPVEKERVSIAFNITM